MRSILAIFLVITLNYAFSTVAQDRPDNGRGGTVHESGRTRERVRVTPKGETQKRQAERAHPGERSGANVGVGSRLIPQSTSAIPRQQVRTDMSRRIAGRERGDYRGLLESVQAGVSTGKIASFSQNLAPQVSLNLRGGESGSYSANQAYYVLENYFKTRKLGNFSFTTVGESESNPYATGSASYNFKGSRERVQVYVSLSLAGEQWVITQINIY
jgi:hypothetical protein